MRGAAPLAEDSPPTPNAAHSEAGRGPGAEPAAFSRLSLPQLPPRGQDPGEVFVLLFLLRGLPGPASPRPGPRRAVLLLRGWRFLS